MVGQASEFGSNVGAIVVKLLGLVVAFARVVHRAVVRRDDEQNEAVLAITKIIISYASRVHAHSAINSADLPNVPAFVLHCVM